MLPATLSAIRAWGVSLMDALAPIQGFPLCWFCKMCRNLSSNFLLCKCKKWAELSRTFADPSEPCTNRAILALIVWFMRWVFAELVGLYRFLFIVQLLDQEEYWYITIYHICIYWCSITEPRRYWWQSTSQLRKRNCLNFEWFRQIFARSQIAAPAATMCFEWFRCTGLSCRTFGIVTRFCVVGHSPIGSNSQMFQTM